MGGQLAEFADQIHQRHAILLDQFDEVARSQCDDRMGHIHSVVVRHGRVERQFLQRIAMEFRHDGYVKFANGTDGEQETGRTAFGRATQPGLLDQIGQHFNQMLRRSADLASRKPERTPFDFHSAFAQHFPEVGRFGHVIGRFGVVVDRLVDVVLQIDRVVQIGAHQLAAACQTLQTLFVGQKEVDIGGEMLDRPLVHESAVVELIFQLNNSVN